MGLKPSQPSLVISGLPREQGSVGKYHQSLRADPGKGSEVVSVSPVPAATQGNTRPIFSSLRVETRIEKWRWSI
jgi:hypothetical protein